MLRQLFYFKHCQELIDIFYDRSFSTSSYSITNKKEAKPELQFYRMSRERLNHTKQTKSFERSSSDAQMISKVRYERVCIHFNEATDLDALKQYGFVYNIRIRTEFLYSILLSKFHTNLTSVKMLKARFWEWRRGEEGEKF